MKICISGFEKSVHTSKILRWFVERGHEVHLLSKTTDVPEKVIFHNMDIEIYRGNRLKRFCSLKINRPFVQYLRSMIKFRKLLKEIKPDVLYSYALLNRYPGNLVLFSGFHPLVITPLNGNVLWAPDRDWKATTKSLKQKYILKYAISKADVLTASIKAQRDTWVKFGADPSKITMVVDPGVDTKLFSPRPKNNVIRNKMGLEDNPVILSTRSFGDIYNIDIIIKSIPMVLKEIPNAKFIFAWQAGGKAEELISLAKELKVYDSCKFVGHVEYYNDMPMYYDMSDVFVSLSSFDASPGSLLEAMASGIPPVCARLPALEEWIIDGENGYLVPQRDHGVTAKAIIKLLKNRAIREMFSEKNVELVRKKADYNRQMEILENVFKKAKGEING